MTNQYLFHCIYCGNNWVGKNEKAQCSRDKCYKSNIGKLLEDKL